MFDFFVKSPVLLTQAMPAAHEATACWGRIINITSEVFALGVPNFSAYVAAKGGQTGLAAAWPANWRRWHHRQHGGARVDSRRTPRQGSAGGRKTRTSPRIPAGHCGMPADVAAAVAYFASDAAGLRHRTDHHGQRRRHGIEVEPPAHPTTPQPPNTASPPRHRAASSRRFRRLARRGRRHARRHDLQLRQARDVLRPRGPAATAVSGSSPRPMGLAFDHRPVRRRQCASRFCVWRLRPRKPNASARATVHRPAGSTSTSSPSTPAGCVSPTRDSTASPGPASALSFRRAWTPWFLGDRVRATAATSTASACAMAGRPGDRVLRRRRARALARRRPLHAAASSLDVRRNRVAVSGLCMPHSPRWHGGRWWLCNSGEGALCMFDPRGRRLRRRRRRCQDLRAGCVSPRAAPSSACHASAKSTSSTPRSVRAAASPSCVLACGWSIPTGRDTGRLEFVRGGREVFDVAFLPKSAARRVAIRRRSSDVSGETRCPYKASWNRRIETAIRAMGQFVVLSRSSAADFQNPWSRQYRRGMELTVSNRTADDVLAWRLRTRARAGGSPTRSKRRRGSSDSLACACLRARVALLLAPTGSGKTLAAFLAGDRSADVPPSMPSGSLPSAGRAGEGVEPGTQLHPLSPNPSPSRGGGRRNATSIDAACASSTSPR